MLIDNSLRVTAPSVYEYCPKSCYMTSFFFFCKKIYNSFSLAARSILSRDFCRRRSLGEMWGPVHTYPEIFVSANFFMRIQKYLRPHVAYTNRIRPSTRIRFVSGHLKGLVNRACAKRLVLILWRQRIQKYTDTSVHTYPDTQRIQKFPLWRAYTEISGYTERIRRTRVDARCIRRKKFADTKISGYVWTGPETLKHMVKFTEKWRRDCLLRKWKRLTKLLWTKLFGTFRIPELPEEQLFFVFSVFLLLRGCISGERRGGLNSSHIRPRPPLWKLLHHRRKDFSKHIQI